MGFSSLLTKSLGGTFLHGGHAGLPADRRGARRRFLACRSPLDRANDRRVSGAAADLPGDGLPDLGFGRIGVSVEQRPGRHHHAGGAEAALQAVALHEALLHRVEFGALLEAFHGAHVAPTRHRGEHGAGLHRLLIHPHDAGSAVARIAAPVRPGEAELIAQEMHQQQATLDFAGDRFAVDRHGNLHGQRPSGGAGAGADAIDRPAQRAPGQLVGQVTLVLGAAAHVRGRGAVLGGKPARLLEQFVRGHLPAKQLGNRRDTGGVRTDGRESDPRVDDGRPGPFSSQTAAPQDTTAQSPARRSTFS